MIDGEGGRESERVSVREGGMFERGGVSEFEGEGQVGRG